MGHIVYFSKTLSKNNRKLKKMNTGNVREWDSEGFPAGYLYLELEQPYKIF